MLTLDILIMYTNKKFSENYMIYWENLENFNVAICVIEGG